MCGPRQADASRAAHSPRRRKSTGMPGEKPANPTFGRWPSRSDPTRSRCPWTEARSSAAEADDVQDLPAVARAAAQAPGHALHSGHAEALFRRGRGALASQVPERFVRQLARRPEWHRWQSPECRPGYGELLGACAGPQMSLSCPCRGSFSISTTAVSSLRSEIKGAEKGERGILRASARSGRTSGIFDFPFSD